MSIMNHFNFKRVLLITVMLMPTLLSCCKYDDSALWNRLNGLEDRVAKLEEICKQVNTNISSLQTIVSALQDNDYITGITPVMKDGKEIGYTITFSKHNPITIYNGKDGANGDTPVVGVKKDSDGIYYWTIDGEFIVVDGQKIKAEGTDGSDGIIPKLEIRDDYWWVSYNNGETWTQLGKATGEDGADSDIIKVTQDENNVYFELIDGTIITIPKSQQFIYTLTAIYKTTLPNQTIKLTYDNETYPIAGISNKLVCIDYGDGSANTSITHTYAEQGEYVVTFSFNNPIIEIGEKAFDSCANLTDITYPTTLTRINQYAFRKTGLIRIIIPNTVKAIGEGCFSECYNTDFIYIPNSVQTIGESAIFQTTGELYVNCDIPSGQDFSYGVLGNSRISKITIGKDVNSIGDFAFNNTNEVTTIEYEKNSQLVHIGYGAFGCSILEEMPIPSSVQTMGNYPFSLCSNLRNFTIVHSGNDNCLVYDGVLYMNDIEGHPTMVRYPPMKEDKRYQTRPVHRIKEGAFRDCRNLEEIVLDYPHIITDIAEGTFMGCANLAKVEGFEEIQVTKLEMTFNGCKKLDYIKIPNTVEIIGPSTFEGCEQLLNGTLVDDKK